MLEFIFTKKESLIFNRIMTCGYRCNDIVGLSNRAFDFQEEKIILKSILKIMLRIN